MIDVVLTRELFDDMVGFATVVVATIVVAAILAMVDVANHK